jgi:prevent-host-death family protein
MSMKSVNIEDARKVLGELVDRARIANEPVLIMRYNKPAAVLVGADWYSTITGEPARTEGGAS